MLVLPNRFSSGTNVLSKTFVPFVPAVIHFQIQICDKSFISIAVERRVRQKQGKSARAQPKLGKVTETGQECSRATKTRYV